MGQLRKRLHDPLERTLRRMRRDPSYSQHNDALATVQSTPKLFSALSADVETMLKNDGSAQMMLLSLDETETPPHRLLQAIKAAAEKLWAHREEILAFVLKLIALMPKTVKKK